MVLHIAGALNVIRMGSVALKLGEDGGKRLAHHVGQHVEAAAVGHADNDFLQAELAAAFHDLLNRRDHGFPAFEAETLGTGVLDLQELLECLGSGQALIDRLLAHGGEFGAVLGAFNALLEPGFFSRILNMDELDADLAAIGVLQDIVDLAHRGVFEAKNVVEEDRAIHICFGEAVGGWLQLRVLALRCQTERIEIGGEVTAYPIGTDQHDGAQAVEHCLTAVGAVAGGDGLGGLGYGGCFGGKVGEDVIFVLLLAGDAVITPAGTLQFLKDGAAVFVQLTEKGGPAVID